MHCNYFWFYVKSIEFFSHSVFLAMLSALSCKLELFLFQLTQMRVKYKNFYNNNLTRYLSCLILLKNDRNVYSTGKSIINFSEIFYRIGLVIFLLQCNMSGLIY